MESKIKEIGGTKVSVNVLNGVELVGDFYDGPSDRGIILLPGFNEHRSSLDDLARKLNARDFKTWTFDINSQGESSGNFDVEEIVRSFDSLSTGLRERYGLKGLGVHGNSVGGIGAGIASAQGAPIDCLVLSGAPAGLQDVFPEWAKAAFYYLPKGLVRYVTIARDIILSSNNKAYREKTHKQFKTENGYQLYVQWGALKIPDPKKLVHWINNAPRLDAHAENITCPILMIYGGEDFINQIKDSVLRPNIRTMYDKIGSKDKPLLIVDGADHSINVSTNTDDCFNQSPGYAFVKDRIVEHFAEKML